MRKEDPFWVGMARGYEKLSGRLATMGVVARRGDVGLALSRCLGIFGGVGGMRRNCGSG